MSVGFPSRWLRVSSTACSALVLAAAGCGGSEETTAPPPQLPAAVAATLDAGTAAVEEALDQDDPETALAQAEELRAAAEAAIAAGDVPGALRKPLRDGIAALIASIEVPEATPPPPPTEPPPAPEPPPTDECRALELLRDAVAQQLESVPEDDPTRAVLEEELAVLDEGLAECQAGNEGNGDGDSGEDDDD